MTSYGFPDGGILAHDDGGPISERYTDLLHLFGTNIVHIDQEEPGVFVKERLSVCDVKQVVIYNFFQRIRQ